MLIEVDGALVGSDLLVEVAFAEIGQRPIASVEILAAVCRGKTTLRCRLAKSPVFQPSALPYNPEALAVLREAACEGRAIRFAQAASLFLVRWCRCSSRSCRGELKTG